MNPDIFHTVSLNLYGIAINNYKPEILNNGILKYQEINIVLPTCKNNNQYSVARKIPVVPKKQTPYKLINNNIYFEDSLIFPEHTIKIIPLNDEKPRNYKGFSFSFEGTNTPYVELRINPKNTGTCPGRCRFCHRTYSFRQKPSTKTECSPKDLVDSIAKAHGIGVFEKISHISMITELFGNEAGLLDYLEEFKRILIDYGCPNEIKIGACSQDVRSIKGLKRFHQIINPKKYSFTLESFSRRDEIMSLYKGISLNHVKTILQNARNCKFTELKINYIAGIDPYHVFEEGIEEFKKLNIIDSIGISIFTVFFSDQFKLRHSEAYDIKYYQKIINLLKKQNIAFYKPDCYEMGFPLGMIH